MIFMRRASGRMTESKTAVGGSIKTRGGGKKWNFWAVALEKLYKTNEARNLSLFFSAVVASLVSLSLQLFWNFSTFACLVCVTNFAALGWRFKCVSHLAWLHFNSRRVQLGGTEWGTGELTLTSVCNCFLSSIYAMGECIIYYFCFCCSVLFALVQRLR